MRKKTLLIGLGLLSLALLLYFVIFRGEISVTVDQSSQVKEGVNVSFSSDDYKKVYLLPANIKLRPGTYTALVSAPGAIIKEYKVNIKAGEQSRLSVALLENPDANLPGRNPSVSEIEEVPYLSLFPKITGDYRIDTETDDEFTKIVKIRITIIHRFYSPDEPAGYKQEREISLAAAEQWLKDNGVPKEIERVVVDR
jgi:hypothetical protein